MSPSSSLAARPRPDDALVRTVDRLAAALATPAFVERGVTGEDLVAALPVARQRCLQRLVQALLRERLIAPEALLADTGAALLALWKAHSLLRLPGLQGDSMGAWRCSGPLERLDGGAGPRPLFAASELLDLVAADLDVPPSAAELQRLGAEIDNSMENDTLCLAYHRAWDAELAARIRAAGARHFLDWLARGHGGANPVLLLEQWGTLGHPWHPNYKTKLGLTPEQVVALAPEFESRVALQVLALRADRCQVESTMGAGDYLRWWASQFPETHAHWRQALRERGLDPDAYLPLPAHPWQVAIQLPTLFAAEIADGALRLDLAVPLAAAPTMSFRTVVPAGAPGLPLIKLPVGLRLTSVQRTVSPRSATLGPRLSSVLTRIIADEQGFGGRLAILRELHGVHVSAPGIDDERARHLAVLYRENPAAHAGPDEQTIPVGALFVADPGSGHPLLAQLIRDAQGGEGIGDVLAYFTAYADTVLAGVLGLYLGYGLACEAHQQNSLLVVDRAGRPRRLLLRDFGDLRIHLPTLAASGHALQPHRDRSTLGDDWQPLQEKLLHAVFQCHLGEVLLLLARHHGIAERLLWQGLRRVVEAHLATWRSRIPDARWQAARTALLEADWPAKSFVRMRLADSSANIHASTVNPLREDVRH